MTKRHFSDPKVTLLAQKCHFCTFLKTGSSLNLPQGDFSSTDQPFCQKSVTFRRKVTLFCCFQCHFSHETGLKACFVLAGSLLTPRRSVDLLGVRLPLRNNGRFHPELCTRKPENRGNPNVSSYLGPEKPDMGPRRGPIYHLPATPYYDPWCPPWATRVHPADQPSRLRTLTSRTHRTL